MIRAYGRMERALGTYGLARRPAETPLEYLSRALTSLRVGRRSVERLSALFERAKFSQHEIDLSMKSEALSALGALRDELAEVAGMKRWNRRRILIAAGLAVVTIGIALLLSGAARGIALYAYLLLLVLIAVVMVGSRIAQGVAADAALRPPDPERATSPRRACCSSKASSAASPAAARTRSTSTSGSARSCARSSRRSWPARTASTWTAAPTAPSSSSARGRGS